MNAQLWTELSEALQQLEADSAVQAVVIHSTLTKGQHATSRTLLAPDLPALD